MPGFDPFAFVGDVAKGVAMLPKVLATSRTMLQRLPLEPLMEP